MHAGCWPYSSGVRLGLGSALALFAGSTVSTIVALTLLLLQRGRGSDLPQPHPGTRRSDMRKHPKTRDHIGPRASR